MAELDARAGKWAALRGRARRNEPLALAAVRVFGLEALCPGWPDEDSDDAALGALRPAVWRQVRRWVWSSRSLDDGLARERFEEFVALIRRIVVQRRRPDGESTALQSEGAYLVALLKAAHGMALLESARRGLASDVDAVLETVSRDAALPRDLLAHCGQPAKNARSRIAGLARRLVAERRPGHDDYLRNQLSTSRSRAW
jgi:cytochrome P450